MHENQGYKLLVLVCLFFLLFCPSAIAHNASVLRVGYVDISGYLTRDANGYYSGYAYEYMEALAPYGRWRMEYVPMASRLECMECLQRGEIDVIPGVLQGDVTQGQKNQLLFSKYPFGHSAIVLALGGGPTSLVPGENYRIGYFSADFNNAPAALLTQAKRDGVVYSPQAYSLPAAVMEAYQRGDIDGFLVDSMLYPSKFPPAAALDEVPTFLVVRAGNEALIKKLDAAMLQIELINPQLQSQLFTKYFVDPHGTPLLLSKAERDYLRQKGKIIVVASPGQKPYTYFENGVHKGVIADVLQQMSEDLGISFEVRETASNNEVMQIMKNGEAEVLADFFYDYNWAHENAVDLTFPYMEIHYVAVMRRNEEVPYKPMIACPRGHYYTHAYLEKMYPADQLLYYDTPQECLEAVSKHQADMTVTKAITAQEDIWRGNYYNLITNGNVIFSHKVAMGVNDRIDPILQNILNKEIAHLNPMQLQGVVNKAVFSTKEDRNVISMIYRYPLVFLGGIIVIALLVIFSLLYMMRVRRRHLQHIRQLAYTDATTGLPNLHWFRSEVPVILKRLDSLRKAGRLFIMVFGVSRLDILREAYGHQLVRDVLCQRVRAGQQDNEWIQAVSVLSGTGRTYCLCSLPDGEILTDLLQDLLLRYDKVRINEMIIHLDLRAGICMIPAEGTFYLMHLMGAADIAYNELLGTARKFGIYDEHLQKELALQKQIESLMEKALEKHEFEIWCQPKYELESRKISGAEALVRWRSPELGFLMPGQFIDLFEHNGFIVRFDYYMLESVCQWQRQRLDAGLTVLPISVNQSRLHMNEEDYLSHMEKIANQYHLPKGCIELELTETAFAEFLTQPEQYKHALKIVDSLKELGFSLSMDDFGSGYSSLALLKMLPMDIMKIDRSLLMASESSKRSQIILDNVIKLGNSLRMEVICEGIDKLEQEQLLLRHGCSYGQGFLYAKPMPSEEFAAFMETHIR